jgi:hypothetical protein
MWELGEIQHSVYPHEWGWLFDCPGCEAECFCEPEEGTEECVYCYLVMQET